MKKCILKKSLSDVVNWFFSSKISFIDYCLRPLNKKKFTIFWIKQFTAVQATTFLYKVPTENNINTLLSLKRGKHPL